MGKKDKIDNDRVRTANVGHDPDCGCGLCKGKHRRPAPRKQTQPVIQGEGDQPAFVTHKKPAGPRPIADLFGKQFGDEYIFNLARTWDEAVTDSKTGETFQPEEIAVAILFHAFHNQEDTWWRDRMSSSMIRNRVSDFVGRVPLKWAPETFTVPLPKCTLCRGTGRRPVYVDGERQSADCSCTRRVYKMALTRAIQKEFNRFVGSLLPGSTEKAQALYEEMSHFFLEE